MEQEQVAVEILGQTITAQYGTLSTGDILRTTSEFAKHLVEDCGAAKYCRQAPVDEPGATEAERARLEAMDKQSLPSEDNKELTVAQLKAQLTERGIEFKGNASKASLQALLDQSAA